MNNQGGLAASSDAVVERHVLGLHIYSEGAMFLSEGSLILQHPGLSGCGCWVPRTRRSGNYQKMLRSSFACFVCQRRFQHAGSSRKSAEFATGCRNSLSCSRLTSCDHEHKNCRKNKMLPAVVARCRSDCRRKRNFRNRTGRCNDTRANNGHSLGTDRKLHCPDCDCNTGRSGQSRKALLCPCPAACRAASWPAPSSQQTPEPQGQRATFHLQTCPKTGGRWPGIWSQAQAQEIIY